MHPPHPFAVLLMLHATLGSKLWGLCPPHKTAIVKVLADTQRVTSLMDSSHDNTVSLPLQLPGADPREAGSASHFVRGDDSVLPVPYRHKMIALFVAGDAAGEVLIFAMYVDEYSQESDYASQVCIKCVDSTPLFEDEEGAKRQDLLSATLLGYLEWAKVKGFREVCMHTSLRMFGRQSAQYTLTMRMLASHSAVLTPSTMQAVLNVPAPMDDKQYVFAYRSLSVRMRTCAHFATWFQRVLMRGMQTGVVHGYRTKNQVLGTADQSESAMRDQAAMAADAATMRFSKRGTEPRDSNSPAALFFSSRNGGGLMDHNSGA